jgi:3-dehydroquinate synthetase
MDYRDYKYANVVEPVSATVSAVVGAGTQVAQTIAKISDMKKRREFEQAFALLDNRQKLALENSLARTNDSNKKLELLFNAVTTLKSAQSVASIQSRELAKTQRERTTAIVIIGGSIVLLAGLYLLTKK